jgi:hypothetical protein
MCPCACAAHLHHAVFHEFRLRGSIARRGILTTNPCVSSDAPLLRGWTGAPRPRAADEVYLEPMRISCSLELFVEREDAAKAFVTSATFHRGSGRAEWFAAHTRRT